MCSGSGLSRVSLLLCLVMMDIQGCGFAQMACYGESPESVGLLAYASVRMCLDPMDLHVPI